MRSFHQSQKKHLLLTGSKKSGKTHLVQELSTLLGYESPNLIPGITTLVHPHSHVSIKDHLTGETSVIGRFSPSAGQTGHQMSPVPEGFLTLGISAMERAMSSTSDWVLLDELGYLENDCPAFQDTILTLFHKKRTITVIRKESSSFLDALRSRTDVYLLDLDEPVCSIGCVIMASGNSSRFGSNKLMADFREKPLISHILRTTNHPLLASRMVVTRHPQVEQLCKEAYIPVLLHSLPGQNDTVQLGLSALMKAGHLDGCLFVPGDQPLLSSESLETILLSFSQNVLHPSQDFASAIYRLAHEDAVTSEPVYGSPILFGNSYFSELLRLPRDKGGRYLAAQYPHRVHPVYTENAWELRDIDTPWELEQLESAQLES